MQDTRLVGVLSSTEMLLAFSNGPVDWADNWYQICSIEEYKAKKKKIIILDLNESYKVTLVA